MTFKKRVSELEAKASDLGPRVFDIFGYSVDAARLEVESFKRLVNPQPHDVRDYNDAIAFLKMVASGEIKRSDYPPRPIPDNPDEYARQSIAEMQEACERQQAERAKYELENAN